MVTMARRTKIQDKSIGRTIDDAIKMLDEHWVYDVAELFTDCAVATHRITRTLAKLKKKPEMVAGHEKELLCEIRAFVSFMDRWNASAKKHLIAAVVCPDEVEWHLDRIRKSCFDDRGKTKMERRDSQENFGRSFETVQTIRSHR